MFQSNALKSITKKFLEEDNGKKIFNLYLEPSVNSYKETEIKRLGYRFCLSNGFDKRYVDYLVDSFCYAFEWTDAPPKELSDNIEHSTLNNVQIFVENVIFSMVYVKGGKFAMGATPEQGYYAAFDEKPCVETSVDSFYLAETPVTQILWTTVMNDNPSHFKGDLLPVERVSWNECQDFLKKINSITGNKFRLPTEAEWEYAARSGTQVIQTKYAGCDDNDVDAFLWHKGNSDRKSHEVKALNPNYLGIYDMCGNISEWCNDWYYNSYSGNCIRNNPLGPDSGISKVYRGGNWNEFLNNCRVSKRFSMNPNYRNKLVGLRLAATKI